MFAKAAGHTPDACECQYEERAVTKSYRRSRHAPFGIGERSMTDENASFAALNSKYSGAQAIQFSTPAHQGELAGVTRTG
jgi:hypothetical protein